jgi:hypothetical protein
MSVAAAAGNRPNEEQIPAARFGPDYRKERILFINIFAVSVILGAVLACILLKAQVIEHVGMSKYWLPIGLLSGGVVALIVTQIINRIIPPPPLAPALKERVVRFWVKFTFLSARITHPDLVLPEEHATKTSQQAFEELIAFMDENDDILKNHKRVNGYIDQELATGLKHQSNDKIDSTIFKEIESRIAKIMTIYKELEIANLNERINGLRQQIQISRLSKAQLCANTLEAYSQQRQQNSSH